MARFNAGRVEVATKLAQLLSVIASAATTPADRKTLAYAALACQYGEAWARSTSEADRREVRANSAVVRDRATESVLGSPLSDALETFALALDLFAVETKDAAALVKATGAAGKALALPLAA